MSSFTSTSAIGSLVKKKISWVLVVISQLNGYWRYLCFGLWAVQNESEKGKLIGRGCLLSKVYQLQLSDNKTVSLTKIWRHIGLPVLRFFNLCLRHFFLSEIENTVLWLAKSPQSYRLGSPFYPPQFWRSGDAGKLTKSPHSKSKTNII